MSGYCQRENGRERHDQQSEHTTKGSSTNDSRIDKFQQRFLSRQQSRLDLNDSNLRRATMQQILQQPHRQRVHQRCQVLRSPRARDCATIHDCPSRRALFRNKKGCVLRDRERGCIDGRWWTVHATEKDDLSGRAWFRRQFMWCLLRVSSR